MRQNICANLQRPMMRTMLHMALVFGIVICYNSEFLLLARALAQVGAQLLIVPTFTYSAGGYHLLRIGCQARALENQLYVALSPPPIFNAMSKW